MRSHVLCSAFGLVLVAGSSAAGAQTVIAPDYYGAHAGAVIVPQQPPVTATVLQPAETVQTTETVHTIRQPAQPAHRQIVTTRTITRRVVPAPAAVAATVPAAPPPVYDVAVPAVAPQPVYDVAVPAVAPQPLYDTTVPQPGAAVPASADDYYSGVSYDSAPPVAAPLPVGPIMYRYVYEPNRILVIDPVTNIAVQAIPR
jgi:hypothetical protein